MNQNSAIGPAEYGVAEKLVVRMTVLPGGERRPVVTAEDIPDYWINLYLIAMRRPSALAARTLLRDAQHLILIRRWSQLRQIDLEGDLYQGKPLTPFQLNDLSAFLHRSNLLPAGSVVVTRNTLWARLTTAEQYLDWLLTLSIKLGSSDHSRAEIEAIRSSICRQFRAHRGSTRCPQPMQLEGLAASVLHRLLEVIDPHHPDNPWSDRSVRQRNYALILCQLNLGLRAGELLSIKLTDYDPHSQTIRVQRRPDDPSDPRRCQPCAKTRGRVLPLNPRLTAALQHYITRVRFPIPGAKRSEYLWVGNKPGKNQGSPIDYSNLQKLFFRLQNVPGIGPTLTSHALRHTFNDHLSRVFDQAGWNPERESLVRNYLAGWSPTSTTAVIYTRRHVREQAQQSLLKTQAYILGS